MSKKPKKSDYAASNYERQLIALAGDMRDASKTLRFGRDELISQSQQDRSNRSRARGLGSAAAAMNTGNNRALSSVDTRQTVSALGNAKVQDVNRQLSLVNDVATLGQGGLASAGDSLGRAASAQSNLKTKLALADQKRRGELLTSLGSGLAGMAFDPDIDMFDLGKTDPPTPDSTTSSNARA